VNLKLFFTIFISVFLAEFGDKTQLATMGFAATQPSKWVVFLASASALVLSSLVGVLVGSTIGEHVNAHHIKRIAGALFLAIGIWLIIKP